MVLTNTPAPDPMYTRGIASWLTKWNILYVTGVACFKAVTSIPDDLTKRLEQWIICDC